MQGVVRDIEQAVADGRQYSALWPAMIGCRNVNDPINRVAPPAGPDFDIVESRTLRCRPSPLPGKERRSRTHSTHRDAQLRRFGQKDCGTVRVMDHVICATVARFERSTLLIVQALFEAYVAYPSKG
jgi:hypothetical protein